MISKLILGLFFTLVLFQAHQVYGDEELPIITIDFFTGNVIDLDKSPQMIRANIQIQNYDPQDGYHFMQIIRLSDGEIIKNTEIFPSVIDENLWRVQVLHYLEPSASEENLIGDYGLRIYTEYGPSESISTFSIVKSSMPVIVTQNTVEELVTPDELVTLEEELDVVDDSEESKIENFVQSEPKIPSWVHDIFVWYAEDSISENELLASLEYLISQGILNVDSN